MRITVVLALAVIANSVLLFSQDRSNINCKEMPGSDAGAQIAACIAALPPSGGIADARSIAGAQTITTEVFKGVDKPGTLLLGSATFTLSGGNACFNVPSNWTVQGFKPDPTTWRTVFTGAGECPKMNKRMIVTTGSHVILRDFKILGNNSREQTCVNLLNGIHDDTVEGIWADHCGIFGIVVGANQTTGITDESWRNIQLLNNSITNAGIDSPECKSVGIEIFPRTLEAVRDNKAVGGYVFPGIIVRGNRVAAAPGLMVCVGIKLNSSLEGVIEDNTIDLRQALINDASVGGISVPSSEGVRIVNNHITGGKNGISLTGIVDERNPYVDHGIRIEDNILTGQVENGIFCTDGIEDLTIRHNTIQGTGQHYNAIHMFRRASHYEGLKISENNISTNAVALDVDAQGARKKPVISNNQIIGRVSVR